MDEIPQLLNVLKQEMSMVGQDHCLLQLKKIKKSLKQKKKDLPGITGYSQICYTGKKGN